MPNVTLISYTPDPERTVAAAARLCYSPSTIDQVMEQMDDEKTASFLDMLTQIGHQSPIEHASFTFGIEGVSRSLLAQITRHRIASFSVQSQRYVDEAGFDYVIPPEIEGDEQTKELFLKAMESAKQSYETLTAHLERRYQKDMAPKAAHKKAIEDARFVLPNACTTKMMVTMNARSLLNFFSLRCCNRAQWEIREVAWQMLKLVKGVAPHLFASAGPGCLRGACPEGKMSCGKAKEVRERFDSLGKDK
ncbi:FAD-dependent thymidylate synthase [Solibaculum mannosilyticum]|uniref:FAD-dependent thymidylate synthase n=1 Tax=Solibaculum mannosilyticum TaxID=2780922 RepID=UPI0034C1C606